MHLLLQWQCLIQCIVLRKSRMINSKFEMCFGVLKIEISFLNHLLY